MPNDNNHQIKTIKHDLFLMLGSNLGERMGNIKLAEKMINDQIGEVRKCSDIYETEPWGCIDQPLFLNKLLLVETYFDAQKVLELALCIEKALGRNRLLSNKWKERSIDIDIIYFDEQIIQTPQLVVPHPRLHQRNFVLIPLADMVPEFVHPVLKKNTLKMISECKDLQKVNKYTFST